MPRSRLRPAHIAAAHLRHEEVFVGSGGRIGGHLGAEELQLALHDLGRLDGELSRAFDLLERPLALDLELAHHAVGRDALLADRRLLGDAQLLSLSA